MKYELDQRIAGVILFVSFGVIDLILFVGILASLSDTYFMTIFVLGGWFLFLIMFAIPFLGIQMIFWPEKPTKAGD